MSTAGEDDDARRSALAAALKLRNANLLRFAGASATNASRGASRASETFEVKNPATNATLATVLVTPRAAISDVLRRSEDAQKV